MAQSLFRGSHGPESSHGVGDWGTEPSRAAGRGWAGKVKSTGIREARLFTKRGHDCRPRDQTAHVLLCHHSLDNYACPVCLLDSRCVVESKGWLPTVSIWPVQPPSRTVLMPPLRLWDKRQCDRSPSLQCGKIGRSGFDPCPKLSIVCVRVSTTPADPIISQSAWVRIPSPTTYWLCDPGQVS